MKLYRLIAVAKKEGIHILRDFRTLILAIAIPSFMLILFGFALKLDVDHVPTIIWDQSKTPQSRELISRLGGSRYFDLSAESVDTYRDLEYAIDKNYAIIALIIPYDFATSIKTGNETSVQLIVDGSDSNTATIATGYVESIISNFSKSIKIEAQQKLGIQPVPTPITLLSRVWFNNDVESKNSIVPGLIGVIMMVISAVLTSSTISREWEQGTMEQLISTPIKVPELIIGKLFPYFVIGMFDMAIIVLMGEYIFEVPMKGNAFLLFGMGVIFLVGALSMGIFISTICRTQLASSQMAMVSTFLPSFLLSGFMSPIVIMPKLIQLISFAVPARYFIFLLRAIYLKGVGIKVLAFETMLLSIFAMIMFTLAIRKFKKKLE